MVADSFSFGVYKPIKTSGCGGQKPIARNRKKTIMFTSNDMLNNMMHVLRQN